MPSQLVMKRVGAEDQQVAIEIMDVSKSGIGFECAESLQIGEVYESYLTIWTKDVLHAFLQIVRIELLESKMYAYGAVFIGMPEMDLARIEAFQMINENQEQ